MNGYWSKNNSTISILERVKDNDESKDQQLAEVSLFEIQQPFFFELGIKSNFHRHTAIA